MPLTRVHFFALAAVFFSAAHASTIDLKLTGVSVGPAGIAYGSDGSVFESIAYAQVMSQSPVIVENGDTINLTLSLDTPTWLTYPFGMQLGSTPNDYLVLSLAGSIPGVNVATTGTISLYLGGQLLATMQNTGGNIGSGLIWDQAPLSGIAPSFDTVTSAFTVMGLTSPASIQSVDLDYKAFLPTQHSLPPVTFGGGQLVPEVPEPTAASMVMVGLSLLALVRFGPRRKSNC